MHALGPSLYVELKDSGHSSNDQGGKTQQATKNGPGHVLRLLRNLKEPSSQFKTVNNNFVLMCNPLYGDL